MKNNPLITIFLTLFSASVTAQNNTSSPYSRYGLGEVTPPTFSHNQAMGGAFIALIPDTGSGGGR